MRLYCLPGLGVAHRLYDRCDFGIHPINWLDWPVMPVGSMLEDYARVMATQVDAAEAHVLIGTSMGGMVAQEMAAITRPQRVIIISSWKGPQEIPWLIRAIRTLRLERLLTDWTMRRFVPTLRMMRWKLGAEKEDAQRLVGTMMNAWPAAQIRVMVRAALAWKGAEVKDLVHIHGDRDALMPVRCIKDAIVIKVGTHMMVYTMAGEVSAAVRSALSAH